MRSMFIAAAILFFQAVEATAAENVPKEFWFFVEAEFRDRELPGLKTDEVLALMKRAKEAGYHGMLVSDYSFGKILDDPLLMANLARVRDKADELGLKVVPQVMPVGASNSILMNDNNLAEGVPVENCPLQEVGGVLQAVEGKELLLEGGFESVSGGDLGNGTFDVAGWRIDEHDREIIRTSDVEQHGGVKSLVMSDFEAGIDDYFAGRTVTLLPRRQYRMRFFVKSLDFDGQVRVLIKPRAADGYQRILQIPRSSGGNWTECIVTFNSLTGGEADVMLALDGATKGMIFFDDVELRAIGPTNLLRRDGCSIRIVHGDRELREGTDFESWRQDYSESPGDFEINAAAPPVRLLPASGVPHGAELSVDYFHAEPMRFGANVLVSCCLRHPALDDCYRKQVQALQQSLRPDGWLLGHDEIRVAGWCKLCNDPATTCGQLLGDNVRRCLDIVHEHGEAKPAFVWNDMFDKHFNAQDRYFLNRSTFADSWKGLTPETRVVNWTNDLSDRKASVEFLNRLGHRQVAAMYYDLEGDELEQSTKSWRELIKSNELIDAVLYTTWEKNYCRLEEFRDYFPAP
jgi:hypothetical protein